MGHKATKTGGKPAKSNHVNTKLFIENRHKMSRICPITTRDSVIIM